MIVNDLEEVKKKNEKKKRDTKKFLKLYIIPIFTIIIFLIIIIALVIPKINEVFGRLDEISGNNDNIRELAQRLSEVQALDQNSNTILNNLDIVNEIATSQNTEVIKFRDKISDLTVQNNLIIESQKLTETVVSADATNPALSGNVNLVEVPILFEITGSFEDMKSFISDLSTIDDFVIVKEMDLALDEDESGIAIFNKWSLKIDLVKYQFALGNNLDPIYLGVPATAKISDEMKAYIDLRLQKEALLQDTDQGTTTDVVEETIE